MHYEGITLLVPDWPDANYQALVPHIKPHYLKILSDLAQEFRYLNTDNIPELLEWSAHAVNILYQFHRKHGYYHFLKEPPQTIAQRQRTPITKHLISEAMDTLPLDVSKGLLRRVAECIYLIPRETRSKYNGLIDWDTDSVWYQLEFFGALMVSDKAIKEHSNHGIISPPYPNNNYLQFIAAFDHEAIVVKTGLRFILQTDLPSFYHILRDMHRYETGLIPQPPHLKPRNLTGIKTLVRHLKDVHHLVKLIILTPNNKALTEQYRQNTTQGKTLESNHDVPINIDKFISIFQADLPFPMQRVMKTAFKGRTLTFGDIKAMAPRAEKLINAGLIPEPARTLRRGDIAGMLCEADGTPLAAASQRLHASSYSDLYMGDIITRLAIIRRLQLIGEMFTSKHLSAFVRQTLSGIHTDLFFIIRHGATHQTRNELFTLFEALEHDEKRLSELYSEFKDIKLFIFELISRFQGTFSEFTIPKEIRFGTFEWASKMKTYYQSIYEQYNSAETKEAETRSTPRLMSEAEVDSFICYLDLDRPDITITEESIRQVFSGKRQWFSSQEEANLKLAASNPADKKDRTNKKYIERILKAQHEKYKAISRQLKSEDELKAKQKQAKAITATSLRFPHHSSLHDEVASKSKTPAIPPIAVSEFIQRKIATLRTVLKMLEIDIADETNLTTAIVTKMTENLYNQDAIEYLVGQIYLSLSDLYAELQDETTYLADFDYLLQVRNYLEHRNPILNTDETPYRMLDETCRDKVADLVTRVFYRYSDMIERLHTRLSAQPLDFPFFEVEIEPDGHCMFESVLTAMTLAGSTTHMSTMRLREHVAMRIRGEHARDPERLENTLSTLFFENVNSDLPPSGIPETTFLYKLVMLEKAKYMAANQELETAKKSYNSYADFYESISAEGELTPELEADITQRLSAYHTAYQTALKNRDKIVERFTKSTVVQEAYCEAIRKSATWGSELELAAIAKKLNIKIVVYSNQTRTKDTVICNRKTWHQNRVGLVRTVNPTATRSITLFHVNGNHYHVLQKNPDAQVDRVTDPRMALMLATVKTKEPTKRVPTQSRALRLE